MQQILTQLINKESLSKAQARSTLTQLSSSSFNPAQTAAFLSIYLMRSITIDEMEGFREALMDLAVPIDLRGIKTLDLCGTGGDGKNTFNISTLAAFVTAASGIKVTKHGNYGSSSLCGSSNVLEELGYQFTTDESQLLRQLDKSNLCFLHAPLFHPALKAVAPIRKQLGVRTFFNLLGPLVNPVQPAYQTTGTFNLELTRIYSYILQNTTERFKILHNHDGYDELSLTAPCRVLSNSGIKDISPMDLGMTPQTSDSIIGGATVKENARIAKTILEGNGTTEQNNVVIANAALAISCALNCSLMQAIDKAQNALLSGKANSILQQLTTT